MRLLRKILLGLLIVFGLAQMQLKIGMEDAAMPVSSYTFLHRNANLAKDEKPLLTGWATTTEDSLRLIN